jgi:hypothetical protein
VKPLIQPRGKIMTTLAQTIAANSSTKKSITVLFLAATAAMIGLTATLVSTLPASDPAWNAPTQLARPPAAAAYAKDRQQLQPHSEVVDEIGALEASRVIPCLMPRAWQRDCQVSAIRTATN